VIVGLTEVAFTLINISAQDQQVIFGGLLLLSVVVPNAGEIYRRVRGRVRRVSPPVSAGGGL
jgi:rhamnose transport system permease protein